MRWLYQFPLLLRSLFHRRKLEQELSEEFAWHLEKRTEQGIAEGLSPTDARRAALRAMEGMAQSQERCRDMRRLNPIDNLLQDLRYAARILRRSPGFAAIAILSLALGIGANTAVFSLIDALLLRPLPVPAPTRLVNAFLLRKNGQPQAAITYPLFDAIRRQNRVFSAFFVWSNHEFQSALGQDVTHVRGLLASGDYFTGLGARPALGRAFTSADDQPGGGPGGPVAVISDAFWARRFSRDPHAVGRGLTLDRIRFTVIGVMPPEFFGAEPGQAPEVWVPLQMDRAIEGDQCIDSRSCWWLFSMARLKPGISEQQAAAHLDVIAAPIMRETLPPAWKAEFRSMYLQLRVGIAPAGSGWTPLRSHFTNPLAILMVLVGVVLLIACANIANLMLARASARQREIAVRLAMGAGRRRIVRQLLTESLLISIMGAAAGVLFARWATRLIVAVVATPRSPLLLDLHPDWRVLLFTAGAAIACGILFGLLPAFRATRSDIGIGLRERTANLRGGEPGVGPARLLLGLQVALSLVLISGAGLFAGSLVRLWNVSLGFDPKNLLLIGIDTSQRPEKKAQLTELYRRVTERVQALPGVRSASMVWLVPLSGAGWDEDVVILSGRDITADQRDTWGNAVGPRYFATMRTPLLAGRDFTPADDKGVGIINEAAARTWFPHNGAVGQQIRFGPEPIRIIGVVADAKYTDLRDPDPRTLYVPASDNGSMTLVIRADASLTAVYPEVRAILHDIAPGTPTSEVRSMSQEIDQSIGRDRLMALLSVFFGVLALLLTSIGLYGILACAVTRRTAEIGVRMALGAQRHNVIWLVLSETLAHVSAGMLIGLAAVLATSRLVASLLYGMRPNDPGTLVLAISLLAGTAAVAAWLPARRATRLDPMTALRDE